MNVVCVRWIRGPRLKLLWMGGWIVSRKSKVETGAQWCAHYDMELAIYWRVLHTTPGECGKSGASCWNECFMWLSFICHSVPVFNVAKPESRSRYEQHCAMRMSSAGNCHFHYTRIRSGTTECGSRHIGGNRRKFSVLTIRGRHSSER